MKKDVHNFHLPLPGPMYEKLRREAERAGVPATRLAREAILWWLRERKRKAVARSIREFARSHAGGELDLDEDLERTSLSHLLEEA